MYTALKLIIYVLSSFCFLCHNREDGEKYVNTERGNHISILLIYDNEMYLEILLHLTSIQQSFV